MREIYPNIDMKLTGMKIRELLKESGHEVKDLQQFLRLEGPQPIYRWMQGKTLPSIYNLYAMAYFLNVKMDDIIVKHVDLIPLIEPSYGNGRRFQNRICAYCNTKAFKEYLWKRS